MGLEPAKSFTVSIGGKSHEIRWSQRAQFRLEAFPDVGKHGLFRQTCIYLHACLVGPAIDPEIIADRLTEDEAVDNTDVFIKAIEYANGEGAADDPLSESGPSSADGSASEQRSGSTSASLRKKR